MTKLDIISYIQYMKTQPQALEKVNNTYHKNMTVGIVDVLTWALRFIDFYNTAFKTKDGEYKKAGWLKAIGIVSALFKLGLELITKKK